MKILGISGAFGHDAAAALVVGGEIVAACEEERFSRIKRSARHPAVLAAQSCLAGAGLRLDDVDVLALGWDPDLEPRDRRLMENRDAFLGDYRWSGSRFPEIRHVPHHVAHAASSWYMSGLDEAAVLVVDGQGEDVSTTVFRASSTGLDEQFRYGVADSLGFFYAAVTRYLGFGPGSAGKVMGLAAYGEPIDDFPELDFSPGGAGIVVSGGQSKTERMRWWLSRLEERFGQPGIAGSQELPGEGLRDAAASAQVALERALGELGRRAVDLTGHRSLILAGGVALNCSANGRLRSSGDYDDIFVHGAAHDAGTALGAALQVAWEGGEPLSRCRATDAFLGARYPISRTVELARRLGLSASEAGDVDVVAADLVMAGEVGAWFRGRSEYGPRALGGRSIVARADSPQTRDRVNRIKRRELWRPLAPALTPSCVRRIALAEHYDFMIEACWLEDEPGVDFGLAGALHVDRSMRPLVVTNSSHPFYALLRAADERHGAAAVINTSFNSEREPMVETPDDALRMFASSDLDFLMLEHTLIQKAK